MGISIIKDTIEIATMTLDSQGNGFIQKRINLQEGFSHQLIQTDIFFDSWPSLQSNKSPFEVVISPYPQIPTRQPVTDQYISALSYAAAGDDSILFKAIGQALQQGQDPPQYYQFPSKEIAAGQFTTFYSDHVYVSINVIGDPDHVANDIRMSFMLVINNKKAPVLTSSMGQLAENHDAMCAELMSNGRRMERGVLRGNVFPSWRFGGIVPSRMIKPTGAGGFFLQLPTQAAEGMLPTNQIRYAVADSRQMTPNYEASGIDTPDWLRMNLNEGFQSGPVRDQWPPIKHADNGNVLCL